MLTSLWRNFRLVCASFIGAAFIVALAFAFTAPASAAINRELSYQAKLLDNSGLPVADGAYSVRFSLYDAATLGTRLWTASGTLSVPTPIQVTVTNGLFTVYLGDTTFQGQNSLDDSINWNSANLYLGVTINADSEMTPRRQLTASPYAFNANQVQGMSPSSSAFGTSAVFEINQTSNTAATGTRTALEVRSQGTSNSNDFLVRAINDLGSAVFTINRQGAVTSSGLLVGLGGVSTTNLTVATVNGQAPCLADGSNCPSGNATQTLQQVTNAGNSTTNTIQFAGGTSTGNFVFQQGVTWANATGTNTTSTNLFATNLTGTNGTITTLGATNGTITNLSATNGTTTNSTSTNLFASNLTATNGTVTTLGSTNGTITNLTATNATSGWLGFTTASGTTLTALNLNSNNVNILGGAINGTVIGNVTPASGVFTNATATTFFATYSSTTNATSTNLASVNAIFTNLNTTNATATNLVTSNSTSTNFAVTGLTTSTFNAGVSANAGSFTSYVMVGGQLVCLANGTNCSAASGTVGTLQQVTNAGNSTTNTIQFAGGTSTANFAVQGTLTVNNLSLASLTVPASLTALSSTATGFSPTQTLVRGDYLYMMESGNQQLAIYDISNPSSPSRVFFTSSGAGGRAMDLLGDQLLVAGDYPNSLRIFDVSNPRNPVRLQATTAGPSGNTRVVSQGNFAYLMGSGGSNFVTMDVSNPNIVRGVATTTLTGTLAGGFDTDGRYVYYNSPGTFGIVDVRVPAAPVEVFATSTGSAASRDLAIQGRYAYVTDVSSNNVGIYDVASSTSPTLVATINTGSAVSDDYALEVAGKYLFIGDAAGIKVYDISTPASPSLVTSIALAGAHGLSLSGRTLAALGSDNTLRLYDIGGANFGGVLADSASIGDLSVRDRVNVGSDVAVRGSITIGEGGLFSQGAINVSGSSTTSTIQGSLNVVRGLSVNGTSVCLSDGTNCQAGGGGSTGTLQTVTNAGNTTTNAIQFAGGTSTANFAVQGTLTATNGSFTNATSGWLGFTTASGTTLTALNLNANNATILGGTATFSSLTVTNTSTFNGTFTSSSVIGNVTTTNSPFVPEAGDNIFFSSVISGGDVNNDGYGALYVTGTAYFGGNTSITHFDAGTSTVKGLTASNLNVTQGLTSASNTLGTVIANDITATNVTSGWLGFATASGTTLTALNLNANNATILDGLANFSDLTWTNATGFNTTTTNFYVSNDLTSDATATFRNDVILGSSPASLITFNGSVNSSIMPDLPLAYNLGNSGAEWNTIYAGTGVFGNGSTALQLFDNNINVFSGDLNIGVAGGYFAPSFDLGVTLGSSTQRFNANFGSVTTTHLSFVPQSVYGNLQIASSTTDTPPVDIAVKDRYAYVISNDAVLRIFDVSNQSAVTLVASTTVGTNPIRIAVAGNYAYITSFFGNTLETYNISNKSAPTLVSSLAVTGAKNLAVYSNHLYVAHTDTLDIYNIEEGIPKLVYTNADSSINTFAFQGQVMYVGHLAGGGSLIMYDIRNPANPIYLGTVGAGSVEGVDVQGSYAYVNDSSPNPDIVRIYNVANPASAFFVGQTGFTHSISGDNRIFAAGKYVYSCNDGNFTTIDVTDPAAPVQVNVHFTDGDMRCALAGNKMYVTGGFASSLKVYQLQGLDAIGLEASAAEFGTLAVQNNADFGDNIRVGRGIEVGAEGITSLGGINVMTTNTTSTLLGNILVGTSTQAIGLHSLFAMDGDDLLVAGNIGSASSIYTNGAFVAGTGTTMYGSNFISSYGAPFEVETNGYGMVVKGGITAQMTATSSLSFVTSTGALTDPRNLVKQGDYVYVLDYLGSQLSIMDVHNPIATKEVGTLSSLFNPASILVDGKYAFITRGTAPDIVSVDISDPTNPTLLNSLNTGFSSPWGIAPSGKYLYVTDAGAGNLKVVDRSNPRAMRVASSTQTLMTTPYDIKIRDRYAYVADAGSGALHTYDLTDPVNPQLVTSTVLFLQPVSIDIEGNYLYLGDASANNIQVVDISNPTVPTIVNTIVNGASVDNVLVQGNYLYVSNYLSGSIGIYDVTDPINPRTVGTYSTGITNPRKLIGEGNKLYLADAGAGKLTILSRPGLDIASADIGSARLGDLAVNGNALFSQDVQVDGGLRVGPHGITTQGTLTVDKGAVINGNLDNLLAQNQSDVDRVGEINFPSNFDRGKWITFSGNYAFVLTQSSNQLLIYDIRKPSSPILVSNTAVSAPVRAQIVGQYIYIVTGGAFPTTIDIYSLTNLSNPTFAGTYASTGIITGLEVMGSHLIMSAGAELQSIDVSDPLNLRVVGRYVSTNDIDRMDISGSTAYIYESSFPRVEFVDLTNIENPVQIGSYNTGVTLANMRVQDHHLFIQNFFGSLSSINVSNPAVPALEGLISGVSWGGASTNGIEINGRYVVVPTGFAQTAIIDVQDPADMRVVRTLSTAGWNGFYPRIYGNYLYIPDNSAFIGKVDIYRLPSIETSGLTANSINTASINVSDEARIKNTLTVDGGLGVGIGGILSEGLITGQDGMRVGFGAASKMPIMSTTSLAVAGGYAKALKVGNWLFRSNYSNNSLDVYDVTNPYSIQTLNTTSSGTNLPGPWRMSSNGKYLFVSGWGGNRITVFDLNHVSSTFKMVSSADVGSSGNAALVTVNNLLYKTGTNGTIDVIDARNPANLVKVGETALSGSSFTEYGDMKVSGNFLYGVNTGAGRLFIVDISNAEHPVEVGTLSIASAQNIEIKGRYAYVTRAGSSQASIVDVSNVSNPTIVNTYSVSVAGDGVVAGNYWYIPSYQNAFVYIYDISAGSSAHLVKTINVTSAQFDGIAVDGQVLYTYDTSNSLVTAYRLPAITAPALNAGTGEFGRLSVNQQLQANADVTVRGNVNAGGLLSSETGVRVAINSTNTSAAVFINSATINSTNAQAWGVRTNRLFVSENPTSTDINGVFDAQQIIEYNSSTNIGLCVDATNNAGTCLYGSGISIAADGTINANAFDLAEYYATSTIVTPGDVLSWDTSASATVRVSNGTPYDRHVAGIVSTSPGFSLGNITSGTVVALSGRVPTKVSAQNGDIHVGDPLTTSNVPGYAMKATKPGMIIGYALEEAVATSTIEVFVKVGWNDNGLFAMNASGTESSINDNLTVGASSVVSSTNLLADSWGLTFRGDAYDLATSSTVSQGFNLFTDILSTTSSQFTIASASGTNLLAMNQSGDVMLSGKLFPSRKGGGMQSDSYIFLDDTLGPGTSTYIATNAAGWQANDSYDFAERYYSPDVLDAGDLVTMSLTGQIHVQRTWSPGQTIMGIVSTRPAFVAGAPSTSTYPIALSGRVPTKVSAQNGQVQIGDPLTASSIPGVAIKATGPGPIVGYALENTTSDMSKIEVFVNPGWWGTASATQTTVIQQITTPVTVTSAEFARQHQGFANITVGMTRVNVTFPSLGAFPNIQVNPRGQVVGGFYTDNYTDTGFTIYLNQEQQRDVTFSWLAVATQTNDPIFQSNGTYGTVDSLSGMLVPGTETTTTVETVTSTTPIIPVTTSTAPVIEVTPSSTEPIVATSTEPVVTTSTDPVIPVTDPVVSSSTDPVTQ